MRLFLRRALPGCLLAVMCTCTGAQGTVDAPALTSQDAVRIALENHPVLRAAAHGVAAAQSGVEAARARKNPEVLIAPILIGDEGAPEAVSVTQPLELNGSRDARLRIAMGASGASAAEAEVSQRAVALAARTAYWDAVLARAVVDLDRQNVQHAQTLAEAATAQVNLGNQPKMHQIKAELEVARANQQLLASEAGAVQAEATLCSAMGVPPGSRVSLTESLVFAAAAVDDAGLLQAALASRPELRAARSSIEQAAGEVDAVRAERRPDVAVNYWQEALDEGPGIGVSVSLPVFDWGGQRHREDQARSELAAREELVAEVENAVRLEVYQAATSLRAAEAQVGELCQRVIGQSRQLSEIADVGYREGALNFLEVLEARRTLRAVMLEYDMAVAEHQKALCTLEWAAGVQVPLAAAPAVALPSLPTPAVSPAPSPTTGPAQTVPPPVAPPAPPVSAVPATTVAPGQVGVATLRRLPPPTQPETSLAEVAPR